MKKTLWLGLLLLSYLAGCGGSSSSEITFENAQGTWRGEEFLAGGASCGDGTFIGVGAGIVVADAEITIDERSGIFYLEWESSQVTCQAIGCPPSSISNCSYEEVNRSIQELYRDGETVEALVIEFSVRSDQASMEACKDSVDFNLFSEDEAEAYGSSPVPDEPSVCVTPTGARLQKE